MNGDFARAVVGRDATRTLLVVLALAVLLALATVGFVGCYADHRAAADTGAAEEGAAALRNLIPPEACPYSHGDRRREAWLKGWTEAKHKRDS